MRKTQTINEGLVGGRVKRGKINDGKTSFSCQLPLDKCGAACSLTTQRSTPLTAGIAGSTQARFLTLRSHTRRDTNVGREVSDLVPLLVFQPPLQPPPRSPFRYSTRLYPLPETAVTGSFCSS